MNIFRSRKGVTPLIATLLLIVFAVALGILTMSVGGSYLEGQAFDEPTDVGGCVVVDASSLSPESTVFNLPSVTVYGDAGAVHRSAECTVPGELGIGQAKQVSVG